MLAQVKKLCLELAARPGVSSEMPSAEARPIRFPHHHSAPRIPHQPPLFQPSRFGLLAQPTKWGHFPLRGSPCPRQEHQCFQAWPAEMPLPWSSRETQTVRGSRGAQRSLPPARPPASPRPLNRPDRCSSASTRAGLAEKPGEPMSSATCPPHRCALLR